MVPHSAQQAAGTCSDSCMFFVKYSREGPSEELLGLKFVLPRPPRQFPNDGRDLSHTAGATVAEKLPKITKLLRTHCW